jgi:hypothetical protein
LFSVIPYNIFMLNANWVRVAMGSFCNWNSTQFPLVYMVRFCGGKVNFNYSDSIAARTVYQASLTWDFDAELAFKYLYFVCRELWMKLPG